MGACAEPGIDILRYGAGIIVNYVILQGEQDPRTYAVGFSPAAHKGRHILPEFCEENIEKRQTDL